MTDPPTAPSTLPHPTVNNTVEEISPGEVNIKGCVIDISHVVYTYAGEDGDIKACAIHVSVLNYSEKKIKLDSLCQIRVKQDGKICMAVNAPDSIGFDQDGYVEPSKIGVYTKYYTDIFFDDMKKLNIKMPEIVAPATDNIDEYVKITKKLLETGYAYKAGDNIYFDVSKFPSYYDLSRKKRN